MFAFGFGIAATNEKGECLDTFFPLPIYEPDVQLAAYLDKAFDDGVNELSTQQLNKIIEPLSGLGNQQADAQAHIVRAFSASTASADTANAKLVAVKLNADLAILSTPEAYLKLHLLSHCLCLPNSMNLDGLFEKLPTVCWTTAGPVDPSEITDRLTSARLKGQHLEVQSVDKFPRMTNYVIPPGVRIADASRVRLGAYLGAGTTVMHAGCVNFNAGALGPNMIEGRISQGVVVGAHSDLGGSSSTMGTLSGGGKIKLSLGENCLVGANAGTGIPLGDRCTIEAGLYITAGTHVELLANDGKASKIIKARELAGQSDLLFIRHSQTGKVICRTNLAAVELNETLHANN